MTIRGKMAPDAEEGAVRQVVEDLFAPADPDLREELAEVFDLVYFQVDGTIADPGQPGERAFEGLPADPAFFAGSVVTGAIWAATLLYRYWAERGRPEARVEAMLGELIGNPAMIPQLRERLERHFRDTRVLARELASFEERSLDERRAGELRGVSRRLDREEPAARDVMAPPPEPAPESPREGGRRTPTPDLAVVVEEHSAAGRTRLHFKLYAAAPRGPEPEAPYTDYGGMTLRSDLYGYLAEFAQEAEKLHQTMHFDRIDARERLERLGEGLAAEILPPPLLAKLDQLRGAADSLMVYAAIPLPWELFRFPSREGRPGAFFCEAFALATWLPGHPSVLELPLRRLGLIAPASDLGAAAAEAAGLLALAAADRQVERLPVRRQPLIAALRGAAFDGLHFAGHGLPAAAANPDLSQLLLEDDEILDGIDIASLRLQGKPLVVLNACHSGVAKAALTRIGGLAQAFVRAGAAAVIGSHWSLNDRLAAVFAAEAYRQLLAGTPLAEAVRRARLLLRDRFPGDPSWIAYTLCGQPFAGCPPAQDAGSPVGSQAASGS